MTTARHKVLAYLSKARSASAREISRSLKLSPASVRHHLRVLVSDGRLELAPVRGRDGRGRPEKVYSLPRAALGHNLDVLSDALLAQAGPGLQVDALAAHLTGESNFAGQPLAKRLNLTIEKLNQMHYHAHWEAGSDGPRFVFGHCPYAAIVSKHPELCSMDHRLLENLTGEPVKQVFRAGKEGSSVCVFLVSR